MSFLGALIGALTGGDRGVSVSVSTPPTSIEATAPLAVEGSASAGFTVSIAEEELSTLVETAVESSEALAAVAEDVETAQTTANSAATAAAAAQATANAVPRMPTMETPIDASTLLRYKFSEAMSPIASDGTRTDALTVTATGTVEYQLRGTTYNGIYFSNSGGKTHASGAAGASNRPPGTTFSAHGWVRLRGTQAGTILGRSYRNDGTWTAPFISVQIYVTSGGGLRYGISRAATASHVGADVRVLSLHRDYHIALTYDGTTARLYIDGELMSSSSWSGTIDFGTEGPWSFGDFSEAGASSPLQGIVWDWRIESTVRNAAFFRDLYKRAMRFVDPA